MSRALLDRWTEEQGKLALAERAQGRCEGCGCGGSTDFAHRARRSQGGLWIPSNGIALCRSCHGWAHANPLHAEGLGWEIDGRTDPAEAAAWIRNPMDPAGSAAWHLLRVEHDATGIRRHVIVRVEPRWIP